MLGEPAAATPPLAAAPAAAEEEVEEDREMEDVVEGRREAVQAPTRRTPRVPTAAEIEAHEDSGHVMYRSWCKECLEARATGGQHRVAVTDAEEDERADPVVGFDYGFMTQHQADTMPILAVRDSRYHYTKATTVPSKGPGDYAVAFLVGYLRDLGFRRVVLKCDNEPSTVSLRNEVRKAARDVEIVDQGPPVGDHQANGGIEMGIRELKRQIRVIRLSTEKKFQMRIPDDHPAMAWLPSFAAGLLARFRLGADGMTPDQRRTGKRWRKPCAFLGARLLPQGGRRRDVIVYESHA